MKVCHVYGCHYPNVMVDKRLERAALGNAVPEVKLHYHHHQNLIK